MRTRLLSSGRRRRPDEVVAHWRSEATVDGHVADGWDHSANEALVEALFEGRDAAAALERVVDARFEAGFTFAECAGDLQSLSQNLPRPFQRRLDPLHMAVVIDAVFASGEPDEFAFSLTGLPDRRYLAARLRETYRPVHQSVRWVLIVVRTGPAAAGWARARRQLRVASVVEEAFWSAHSVAAVGHDCHVALQPDRADAASACARVIATLAEEQIASRCWIEALPPNPEQISAVIEAFSTRAWSDRPIPGPEWAPGPIPRHGPLGRTRCRAGVGVPEGTASPERVRSRAFGTDTR